MALGRWSSLTALEGLAQSSGQSGASAGARLRLPPRRLLIVPTRWPPRRVRPRWPWSCCCRPLLPARGSPSPGTAGRSCATQPAVAG
eukprot:10734829-Alexandrium_andersonii.AAC.1